MFERKGGECLQLFQMCLAPRTIRKCAAGKTEKLREIAKRDIKA